MSKILFAPIFIVVSNIRKNNKNLCHFAKIFVNIHEWYRPLVNLYEDFLTGSTYTFSVETKDITLRCCYYPNIV